MSEILREVLPRIVLALLLLSGAYFAFFESVYLQDQAAEFGEVKIALWMWVFRGITAMLFGGGAFFAITFVKRLLT